MPLQENTVNEATLATESQSGAVAQPDLAKIKNELDGKVKGVQDMMQLVILILLFMVAGLLLDAFHFNSATYKEYSEKTASVETTQKINEVLLKQIQDSLEQSRQDREIIKQLLKK